MSKSSKLADAVRADSNKSIQARIGSGPWLHDAPKSKYSLRFPPEKRHLVADLFHDLTGGEYTYKRGQKILDLEIILANVLKSKTVKPVSVSLNRNSWKKSRYRRASVFSIQLIRLLYERGLIHMKRGYHTQAQSRMTRIWRTSKLLDYCPVLTNTVINDPVELVELRDYKRKLLEYTDTDRTRRVRKILQKANDVNGEAKIECDGHLLKAFLVAIYKNKFTLYGRLHTRGYRHYQGYGGEERKQITINGEPVVELDFSGLHPRLLYAAEGVPYNKDPYTVVHADRRARHFLKAILLAMLNAKDDVDAQRGANFWLRKHHAERSVLKTIGITRARPLMDAFVKAHGPIAHHFCKGKETGLRIMNQDAAIALDVVGHFTKQNVPILAVHDSFIVQRRYKDELRATMERAYSKHTGGFRCPIK